MEGQAVCDLPALMQCLVVRLWRSTELANVKMHVHPTFREKQTEI